MLMLMDISEQVKNKRLKEINLYKDELLSTVSHDLKTPLNGMLQLVQSNEFESDIGVLRQNNHLIYCNGAQLMSLIHDILDYSDIQKGVFELRTERFSLSEAVAYVFELFQYQADQKGIALILETQLEAEELQVVSDQQRLRQVLTTLIGNSVKFTSGGKIVVHVEQKRKEEGQLEISVSDTGCGMSESLQKNLFRIYGTFDHNKGTKKVLKTLLFLS